MRISLKPHAHRSQPHPPRRCPKARLSYVPEAQRPPRSVKLTSVNAVGADAEAEVTRENVAPNAGGTPGGEASADIAEIGENLKAIVARSRPEPGLIGGGSLEATAEAPPRCASCGSVKPAPAVAAAAAAAAAAASAAAAAASSAAASAGSRPDVAPPWPKGGLATGSIASFAGPSLSPLAAAAWAASACAHTAAAWASAAASAWASATNAATCDASKEGSISHADLTGLPPLLTRPPSRGRALLFAVLGVTTESASASGVFEAPRMVGMIRPRLPMASVRISVLPMGEGSPSTPAGDSSCHAYCLSSTGESLGAPAAFEASLGMAVRSGVASLWPGLGPLAPTVGVRSGVATGVVDALSASPATVLPLESSPGFPAAPSADATGSSSAAPPFDAVGVRSGVATGVVQPAAPGPDASAFAAPPVVGVEGATVKEPLDVSGGAGALAGGSALGAEGAGAGGEALAFLGVENPDVAPALPLGVRLSNFSTN